MNVIKDGHCFDCGNMGPEEDSGLDFCPACNRERQGLNLELEPEQVVTKLISQSERLGIPAEYIANEWSYDLFFSTNGDPDPSAETHPLKIFMRRLSNIHSIFARGDLPGASAIIIAPSGFSKVTWAFSCMTHAMKHGYSIAPFLDTVEANRVLTVNATNPSMRQYGDMSMEEYVSKDVLFLTVTKGYLRKEAWSVILDILSKRSRKGLATFIISSFSEDMISDSDRTGSFHRLLSDKIKGRENPLKVPAKYSYSDIGGNSNDKSDL